MIDVAKEGHKLPAINLAKLIRLYDAVRCWQIPSTGWAGGLGVGADAGAGDAYHRPEGTDGELGRLPALEAAEAAELLNGLCFSEPQSPIRDAGKAQTSLDMISARLWAPAPPLVVRQMAKGVFPWT